MSEQDEKWKLFAVELAVKEALARDGQLADLDDLFVRAQEIYDKGYEVNLFKWRSIWEDKKQDAPEKKEEAKPSKGEKKCPGCGELLPKKWAKHAYKTDGTVCGYEFNAK